MKKLNRNSLENDIKLNKENCIKRNNEGITLIALIVTIVVMIVIAGVSINMTIGENGIFTKAVKAKEMQETAEIKEKFELKQAEARIALGGESLTLENYLKYLVDQGMIDESDIEDTADSNIKTILVDNKYIYTVVKKDDGSIGLEYEGKAGKLLPKIKSVNTKSTTSSIEVKVDATRVDGGEYRFYIKDVASGEDYKKKEANKTGEYIFTGLEQNREFKIKIEVENKNGIAESETNVIRTVTVAELTQADLEFTYNPNEWTKDKIVVTVNAKVEIPTGYTLQTSKDMTKWENKATQEFTANGYIYVRLFDGTNGGSYAVGEVTKIDTEKPKVTTSSSTSNSITFSGTDNASGIIGYAVTTTKVEPTNFVAVDNTKALNNITIGERSQKTEYYVWLKDKAENVSEPVTIKTDEATGITQADINFTYSPSEWTNEKVTVTASLKTTIPTGYTLQTSKTATNWENKMAQEFTANGYIYVRLFDGTNGGSYAVGEVSKIDKEKPKVTTSSSTSNSITFSGTDNASGIIGYKVTTSSIEPTSFDSCTSTTTLNNKQVTGLTANTTYYIWLKDAARNISEAKTEKTPTLVTSIALNKTTLNLVKGEEETLTVTVNPTNATNKEITWSTSANSIATVSTTGKVTAVAAGTATITATAKDGSGKLASCTITVKSYDGYVNYPIDLNGDGDTRNDWMLFYKADGNAEGEENGGAYAENVGDYYIIAADYLKNADDRLKLSQMGTITKNGKYSIYWEANITTLPRRQVTGTESLTVKGRTNTSTTINKLFMQNKFGELNSNFNSMVVSTLINTANWNGYVNTDYADYAIGAPTLEMWVASWNIKYGDKLKLYTNKNSTGYYVGTGSNSTTTYYQSITTVDEGYKNVLYFPYREKIDSNRCSGTFLASPSNSDYRRLMDVTYGGLVSTSEFYNDFLCVRPLVHLRSDIQLEKNATTGIWEKVN